MRRHAPFEPIDPNICMWGGVADVINCANFFENPSKSFGAVRPQKIVFPIEILSFIALTTVSAPPCRTVILVLNCSIGSYENYASHCSELAQLYQQPVDAVLRSTFIWKLCYKLPSIVAFTFMQNYDQNFVFFTEQRHVDRQCGV